mgnify:CR=1 FL=1
MTRIFHTPKRMAALLLASLLPLLAQAHADLNATIDSLLTDSIWQTAQVGICIYDISADSTLYAFNAHQRMRPASTEKVVTAVAALDNLGPSHPFRTRAYTTASIANGVLQGDLWLVGGMDPTLTAVHLQRLAGQIRAQGIDSIAGRRTCPKCKAGYHVKNLPPKVEGICDKCGAELARRKDDNPETVRDRLDVYHAQTEPLIAYYRDKGILKTIDGVGDVKSISAAFLAAM